MAGKRGEGRDEEVRYECLGSSLKDPNLGKETRDVGDDEETKDTDSMDMEVESGKASVPSSRKPVVLQNTPPPPSFLE